MNSRYKKNKATRKAALKRKATKRKKKFRKILLTLLIITLLGFLLWGKFGEVNIISVNDNKVISKDIPKNFNNIKIVHFSDMFYGTGFNKDRLEKLVTKINSYKPDIVVFTGDLISKNYNPTENDLKVLTTSLSKIDSNLGKYTIIGDNDYNNENFNTIMYDSDFKILKNNYDTIYNKDNTPIVIYGIDSYLKGEPKLKNLNNKEIKNISYKIVLLHEGDYISEFVNNYDVNLILGGNSLNGQIKLPKVKPFYLPKGSKEYYDNYYKTNNTDIYISNGLGSFKFDFRLFNPPSINIYRLSQK